MPLKLKSQDDERTVEMPEIPTELRQPSERADYLVVHFWDKADFADNEITEDEAIIGRSFANFLSVLPYSSSSEIVTEGFRRMIDKSHENGKVYKQLTGMAEDYLNDRESPWKSEETYLLFLRALSTSQHISETNKARIDDRIELMMKNPIGGVATDFVYSTRDGNQGTLKEYIDESEGETMLIFFDPECDHCDEVIDKISANEEIKRRIKTKKLRILAIYPGENKKSWEAKADMLPSEWTIGICPEKIDEEELYYLPSMPTIYLLDAEGRVKQRNLEI